MKNRTMGKSFQCAIKGVEEAIRYERNIRFHLLAVFFVTTAGVIFQIDAVRWAVLSVLCGLVIAAELLNTALETLVDMVTNQVCEEARKVKDMAAGAVLITAIFAILAGIALFWEPVMKRMTDWMN